jgi:predicted nuclease with TOPRIM domain
MKLRLHTLILQCRQSRETITFARQVTFFHGQVASGKSSVARLIDFCFGGNVERTPAIRQELLSVQLSATLGANEVIFYRALDDTSSVQVSWRGTSGGATIKAPLDAGPNAIWEDNIYNLSDLVFYLLDITPPRVRKNKRDADAQLVRLSFRDILWYCYLAQDDMDSSFFNLEGGFKQSKSRDAIRFVIGFFSNRLNELEISLETVTDDRYGKLAAAKQIRAFLGGHGLGTVDEIKLEAERARNDMADAINEQEAIRNAHREGSHFVDDLRAKLRELNAQLDREESVLPDISRRLQEHEALKAELLSTRFKLARADAATVILTGIAFEACPLCGTDVSERPSQAQECSLCQQIPNTALQDEALQADTVIADLAVRIEELQETLTRQRAAYQRQERKITRLQNEKLALDSSLNNELSSYDSAFLSRFRDVERRFAMLEERVRNLQRLSSLPEAVAKLEEDGAGLEAEITRLRNLITAEKLSLSQAEQQVQELETVYLNSLLACAVPGIKGEDTVLIDRKGWFATIISGDNPDIEYTFLDAGSGGKKTLLKVCYALALHKVAAAHNLPLPTFLMIDSPMKNISADVNRNNFFEFYNYLFALASNELEGTQFIIIDNEFPDEVPTNLDLIERKMTPNDPDFPPLIPYYHGA